MLTVIVSDLEETRAGPVQLDGSQNIVFLVQRHGSLVETGQVIYMVPSANSCGSGPIREYILSFTLF